MVWKTCIHAGCVDVGDVELVEGWEERRVEWLPSECEAPVEPSLVLDSCQLGDFGRSGERCHHGGGLVWEPGGVSALASWGGAAGNSPALVVRARRARTTFNVTDVSTRVVPVSTGVRLWAVVR